MAQTSTLKQIRDRLLQETGLGKVGSITSGTSSTVFVSDTATFHTATTGAEWPPGSVVRITSGSAAGSVCKVSKFDPTTGTFTLVNTMSATPTNGDAFVISRKVENIDRIDEAINRALLNRCSRWMLVPATFVPDGDMLNTGSSALTNWGTTSSATASKVVLSYPEVFAAQALHCVTSGANGYVQGDAINVVESSTSGEGWIFLTFLRAAAASSTAQFDVWDVTNNAAVTISWLYPTPTTAKNTTTSREFITIGGTFVIPANCTQIAPRLTGVENPATVELGPIIMMPQRTTIMPLQPRVLHQRIGNFYFIISQSAFANPNELFATNNINRAGREVRLVNTGNNLAIGFGGQSAYASPPAVLGPIITSYDYTGLIVGRTVVYDEEVFGQSVSADTDTTNFALPYVAAWAEYEMYERLYQEAPLTYDNYGRPRPKQYESELKRAGLKALAAERTYGPGDLDVAARVGERWA